MFKNKERHFDLNTRFSCDISDVLLNNIIKTIQIRRVLRDSILHPDHVCDKSHERNTRGVGNNVYNYIMMFHQHRYVSSNNHVSTIRPYDCFLKNSARP